MNLFRLVREHLLLDGWLVVLWLAVLTPQGILKLARKAQRSPAERDMVIILSIFEIVMLICFYYYTRAIF